MLRKSVVANSIASAMYTNGGPRRPKAEAEQAGYEDFFANYKRENNRYPIESENYEDWLRGYDRAKSEFDLIQQEMSEV